MTLNIDDTSAIELIDKFYNENFYVKYSYQQKLQVEFVHRCL